MSRSIPCFICQKLVELHNEDSIAVLCEEHRTQENLKKMSETPVHTLQNILNRNMERVIEDNKSDLEYQVEKLTAQLETIKNQLNNQVQAVQESVEQIEQTPPVETKTSTGRVNEYGELI